MSQAAPIAWDRVLNLQCCGYLLVSNLATCTHSSHHPQNGDLQPLLEGLLESRRDDKHCHVVHVHLDTEQAWHWFSQLMAQLGSAVMGVQRHRRCLPSPRHYGLKCQAVDPEQVLEARRWMAAQSCRLTCTLPATMNRIYISKKNRVSSPGKKITVGGGAASIA